MILHEVTDKLFKLLLNGKIAVGNAKKLGGHDSEHFASADNVKKNDLWTELTSGFDLNNAKGKYRTSSGGIVNSLLNKPTLAFAGGEITVDWFPTEKYNLYGMQMLRHTNSSGACDIYIRYANNTTFTEWECIATTADLANYLPKTGGEVSGDLQLVSSDTTKKVFRLKNSLRTINFIIYTDGTFRIEDATNGKKLIDSSVSGVTSINGTASGNLPLNTGSGQAVTGSGTVPLTMKTTASGGVFMQYMDSSGVLGYLGFGSQNTPAFGDGNSRYSLHHDGNSAKVVVSETPLTAEGFVRVW